MSETRIRGQAIGDGTVNHLDLEFTSTPAINPILSTTSFVVWDAANNLVKISTLGVLEEYFNTKYSLSGHTHTFASLTSKPTTLSGYGITDTPWTSYLPLSGGTLTGTLNINTSSTAINPLVTSPKNGYYGLRIDLETALINSVARNIGSYGGINGYVTGFEIATTHGTSQIHGLTIPTPEFRLTKNNKNNLWLVGCTALEGASQINSRLQVGYDQWSPNNADIYTLSVNGTGNFTGNIISGSKVTIGNGTGTAVANSGFWTDCMKEGRVSLGALNAGNGYGIFYHEGASGRDGNDSIDFAFDTTTSVTSAHSFKINGDYKLKGALTAVGSVTGASFSGAGTGLTGTASSLVAGNTNSISNSLGNIHTWTGTQNNFLGNGNTASTNNVGMVVYSTGGNGAQMSFHRSGAYAINMGLDSDNVFRIGGWSAAANRLQMDMSGNLTMAGDVIAYSDARVKTNIKTIEKPIDKIKKLRGVTYNRTDSNDISEKIGVIAQEIKQILPQVVHEQKDGILGVSYGNIVALLIEGMKAQQLEIDDLKRIINNKN